MKVSSWVVVLSVGLFVGGCGADEGDDVEASGGAISGTPGQAKSVIDQETRTSLLNYLVGRYSAADPEQFHPRTRRELPESLQEFSAKLLRTGTDLKPWAFQATKDAGNPLHYVLEIGVSGETYRWIYFANHEGLRIGACRVASADSDPTDCTTEATGVQHLD